MAIPKTVRHLTEAEYLAIERAAEFKSEFFDGEMFAMADGSPMHSLIATNLASEVRSRLKDRPCVPFNSDLRLKIVAPASTPIRTSPSCAARWNSRMHRTMWL